MISKFNRNSLSLDVEKVTECLSSHINKQIVGTLKKQGAVVGISGGIDSSLAAALCCRAVGKEKTLGVIMPEKDSSSESRTLAEELAGFLGIDYVVENITPVLDGFGCYRRRDEAIKRVIPEYTPECKTKITIASNILEKETLNYFKLSVETPDGGIITKRMPLKEYLQIVAASNFKQRTRMGMLYYHAERLNRAVVGTGNKNEHDLGFFVKYGDGGTDLKPIAHFFKTQIYQLARYLNLPEKIIRRIPTTDTYSAEVTQTEFFFGVDFDVLDVIWYGIENYIPHGEIAEALGLTVEQVERVARDIVQKGRTTEYLRMPPIEMEI